MFLLRLTSSAVSVISWWMFNPDDGHVLLNTPQTVLCVLCTPLGYTHILSCCWVDHSTMVGHVDASIIFLLLHMNISSHSQGMFDRGQQNYGSSCPYFENAYKQWKSKTVLPEKELPRLVTSSSTTVQLLQKNCFFCLSLTERHQALLGTCALESSICHQQMSVARGLWHGWAVTAAAEGKWAPHVSTMTEEA